MTMSKITVLDILGKLQRKKSIMESILVNPDWNLLKRSLPKIFFQAIPKILRTAFPVCVCFYYIAYLFILNLSSVTAGMPRSSLLNVGSNPAAVT